MRLLAPFPGIEIAVTDRSDGNMSTAWEDADIVLPRRRALYDRLGWDTEKAALIHVVGAPDAMHWVMPRDTNLLDPARQHSHQGLATGVRHMALNLLVADCAPVVFFDPVRRVHAIAHCGRRETFAGMPGIMVRELAAHGSDPADLRVWIGPCIRPCCYVYQELRGDAADMAPHVRREQDGWHVDFVTALHDRLRAAGVHASIIIDTMECTAHDATQFSHYRDATVWKRRDEGRFLVAARQV